MTRCVAGNVAGLVSRQEERVLLTRAAVSQNDTRCGVGGEGKAICDPVGNNSSSKLIGNVPVEYQVETSSVLRLDCFHRTVHRWSVHRCSKGMRGLIGQSIYEVELDCTDGWNGVVLSHGTCRTGLHYYCSTVLYSILPQMRLMILCQSSASHAA